MKTQHNALLNKADPLKPLAPLKAYAKPASSLQAVRELTQHLKATIIAAKGENIQSYDLAQYEKNDYTDVILIATASSTLHLKALGSKVQSALKTANFTPLSGHKRPPLEERWLIIDCGSIIIHLFMKEDRDYYALDQKILAEINDTPQTFNDEALEENTPD